MKILILTALPLWHPGTAELAENLAGCEVECEIYDPFNMRILDTEGHIKNALPEFLPSFAKRLLGRLFRQSALNSRIESADIIDIHFVDPNYHKLLKSSSRPLICTFFGSDLFRSTAEQKKALKPLVSQAAGIIISKNMVPYFEEHFESMPDKYILNQYGSKRLDMLDWLLNSKVDRGQMKKELGLRADKITITLGYNGKKEQQHLLILKAIMALPEGLRSRLQIVLPMTYGGEVHYHNQVEEMARRTNCQVLPIKTFLSDAELVNLRLASDITVNAQTTDALSSSLKEAMAAGDVIITGDWLPYDIYEELGIFTLRTSEQEMSMKLQDTILNLDKYRQQCEMNRKHVMNFASWKYLTPKWISDYKRIYEG